MAELGELKVPGPPSPGPGGTRSPARRGGEATRLGAAGPGWPRATCQGRAAGMRGQRPRAAGAAAAAAAAAPWGRGRGADAGVGRRVEVAGGEGERERKKLSPRGAEAQGGGDVGRSRS